MSRLLELIKALTRGMSATGRMSPDRPTFTSWSAAWARVAREVASTRSNRPARSGFGDAAPMSASARTAAAALRAGPYARAVLPLLVDSACAAARAGTGILRLPFDTARAHHARCVQTGIIERSMLASRDFECALGAVERLTLGPFARRL